MRQPPFVTLAFAKFATWHNDADDATANATLAAMGARLVGHEEDAGAWPLDDEPALRDIYTNLAGARTPFDADGIGHMVKLAKEWSKSPERAVSAAKLYAVLAKADPAQRTALGQEWAKRFFTDLPTACQQAILLTAGREGSPPELRAAIATTIATLRGAKALGGHQIEAFSRLFTTLDLAILHDSPFAEQVNQLIDDTVTLTTQNPGDHLVSKARAFAGNLSKLPPEKAKQLLDSFAHLQPQPKILAGVYDEMTEVWPVPATEAELITRPNNCSIPVSIYVASSGCRMRPPDC